MALAVHLLLGLDLVDAASGFVALLQPALAHVVYFFAFVVVICILLGS